MSTNPIALPDRIGQPRAHIGRIRDIMLGHVAGITPSCIPRKSADTALDRSVHRQAREEEMFWIARAKMLALGSYRNAYALYAPS